jgi:hypothetical protein
MRESEKERSRSGLKREGKNETETAKILKKKVKTYLM